MDPHTVGTIVPPLLVFLVAALYSSVGHGGASGYLAILSLLAYSPVEMSTTALMLNVLVAGISFATFARARHFSWSLTWPFAAASIPAAFLGGAMHVANRTYFLLLAAALLIAAARLAMTLEVDKKKITRPKPPFSLTLPSGGLIGILSGIVGIGGGILLSPLIIIARWADPKKAAATSAFFIVVNSLAGLAGRFLRGGLHVEAFTPLLLAAFVGGLLGSRLGATSFTGIRLRRVLALVLVVAAVKMVMPGHQPSAVSHQAGVRGGGTVVGDGSGFVLGQPSIVLRSCMLREWRPHLTIDSSHKSIPAACTVRPAAGTNPRL